MASSVPVAGEVPGVPATSGCFLPAAAVVVAVAAVVASAIVAVAAGAMAVVETMFAQAVFAVKVGVALAAASFSTRNQSRGILLVVEVVMVDVVVVASAARAGPAWGVAAKIVVAMGSVPMGIARRVTRAAAAFALASGHWGFRGGREQL